MPFNQPMKEGTVKKEPMQEVIDSIGNAVDKAIVVAVDANAPDVLLARLAEAHAGVIKADVIVHVIDISNDQERIYADEIHTGTKPKPLALPSLQKQPITDKPVDRPGIAKKLKKPDDFECPTCHAEAHTTCFRMTSHGRHGQPTTERRSDDQKRQFHTARYALSKTANTKIRAAYDREHYGSEQPVGGGR